MTDLSINIPNSFNDSVNPYATSVIPQEQYGFNSPQFFSRTTPCTNIDQNKRLSMNFVARNTNVQNFHNCIDLLKVNGFSEADDDDDEDDEQVEIIKEEIVLRRAHHREIFGLTLSYSAVAANDNSESEVYISAIEVGSAASKQSGIKIGDQILQINNMDVHSKAQVVSLFQSCGLEVTMLLGRPNVVSKKDSGDDKTGLFHCGLHTVDEAEYSLVYDNTHCCKNNKKYMPQLDKDSGIGRCTDDTTKTEEISECDSARSSGCKSCHLSSLDSNRGYVDLQHISSLMKHLAIEYNNLQRLLQGPPDCPSPLIQPLPPPIVNQLSSRIVPRMGTRLEAPQLKIQNITGPASSSNTSSCSTGLDSTRSSPITMELRPTYTSSPMLSLKLDHNSRYHQSNFLGENFQLPSSYANKLNNSINSDKRSATSSSVSDNLHSPLTIDSFLTPNITPDTDCHYYDVYEPATSGGHGEGSQTKVSTEPVSPSLLPCEHEYVNASFIRTDRCSNKVEWVVKKRPDGTRYILRRPVRNKFLKDRAKKVFEERCGLTTEEEENSIDFRINKYLGRSDKRKHHENSTEKKAIRRDNESMQSTKVRSEDTADQKYNYGGTAAQRRYTEPSLSGVTSLF